MRHGFRVGKLHLLVGYTDASALTERRTISRLPNTPAWFAGMTNLRGIITPVYDLARYLGLEHTPGQAQMLLTVARGGDPAALLIDGTSQLINTADLLRMPLEERHRRMSKLAPFFTSAVVDGRAMWFEFAAFDWLRHASEEFLH